MRLLVGDKANGSATPSEQRTAVPVGLNLEPALCPICTVDDVTPVAVGEDFEYRTSNDTFMMVNCRRCGLLYLSMRPTAGELNRIYPDHYHAFRFEEADFGLAYKVRRWLETKRLKRWTRGLKPNARILDVGCGDGFHLRLLRDLGNAGWSLEGIDADPRAVEAASKHQLTVHQGTIEEVKLTGGYDLIITIMTIEHVPNPVAFLARLKELLAPGGRLVIVTDNAGSPDAWWFQGRHWGGYHFPRHFHLFSRKTLAKAGDAAGLKAERITTSVSPVNWVYSFRNWFDDWGMPRWLVNRFSLSSVVSMGTFTITDLVLSYIRLGGNLQATFRKPTTEGGK